MFKLEVTSNVQAGSYKSKKSGELVQYRDQEAYIHLPGAKYPQGMRIRLKPQQAAFAEGVYVLSPKSFSVGSFGDLQLNELVLDPLPAKG